MSKNKTIDKALVFLVLDAMDAPHSGRILRLRIQSAASTSIRSLKGSEMKAISPEGRECRLRIEGFALFGGKPSDERLQRTGRLDVHIEELDDGGPVGLRWQVTPA